MLVMPDVQFLENEKGEKTFAVIPYDKYKKLVGKDEPTIPHEVVGYTVKQGFSLLKAWRKYLGKTQKEIAEAAGITQAALSQMEKTENPHSATLEKLAVAMGIDVAQLED